MEGGENQSVTGTGLNEKDEVTKGAHTVNCLTDQTQSIGLDQWTGH